MNLPLEGREEDQFRISDSSGFTYESRGVVVTGGLGITIGFQDRV